jgi:hypothetical protein
LVGELKIGELLDRRAGRGSSNNERKQQKFHIAGAG